ncbi:MAG: SGNH/GDSL hydrolase family protein, partial [Nesterenkonia sp.]|nr:SGNH/GDSL hydrolase family protein [Nesterenkonia sp.]
VRRNGMRLPEASGPRDGLVGTDDGAAELPLRVAVVGDSTAAGCGVDQQTEGFCAQFAEALAARTERAVQWSVRGRNGARAFEVTRDVLPQLEDSAEQGRFDVVAVLVGVNDALSNHSPDRWESDLGALLDAAATIGDQVLMTGIPEFGTFPALPGILARHLDDRASRLDEVSRRVCAARDDVEWFGADQLDTTEDFFAVDGFHPNADGYQQWARLVADRARL